MKNFCERLLKFNEYVLTSEATQILGVSPNTIRPWARDGKVPVFQNPANSYRMFRKADLDNFLKQVANSIHVNRGLK